ncbi:MAG: PRC-barrel domain-containing protein [Desulforhopalus sp.]
MKKLAKTFISALTVLAMASPLYAVGEQKVKTEAQPESTATQSISAGEFQGMQVVSQEGDKIGEISKAHSDQQSGQVQFVIISKSDAERDHVAVPLEALRFDEEKKQATLMVDESKLANAPKQEDKSTQVFVFELEEHYGVAPAWQKEAEIMGPPVPPTELPEQRTDTQ